MVKVLVAGFNGAMGQKVVDLVQRTPGFELVAGYDPAAPTDKSKILGNNIPIFRSLSEIQTNAEIWIDFTIPTAAFTNAKFAIEHQIAPIVGTTGMGESAQQQLVSLSLEKHCGGIIAPNFGLSAVLLMKFAAEASQYFADADVIEMHHPDKIDAPSGTALQTAQMIAANRQNEPVQINHEESLPHVLGGEYQGVKIHSIRLPGYIAHEQVLFGGRGEALTIRQDSFDRESFMGGVKVAMQKVLKLDHLVIGLDKIL